MNLQITLKNNKDVHVNPESRQSTNEENKFRTGQTIECSKIGRKKQTEFRIIGGNINTFPINKYVSNKMKADKLKQLICNYRADVVTFSEHNLNITKVPMENRPDVTMEGWRKNNILKMSCLEQGSDMYSLGGNGVISLDDAAKMMIQFGHDTKKLGRWTWCTYKLKQGHNLTIVSCYRPSESQITYKVQLAQLANNEDADTNRYDHHSSWYLDLKDVLESKISRGDHIIVVGDFNENLENSHTRIRKLMNEL